MKFNTQFSRRLFACIGSLIAAISLSSCGGGGSDGENAFGEPTVRPKTLNNITLALDSFISFTFIPNSDVPTAINSGDVEVGAFSFTRIDTEVDAKPYPNALNGKTNTTFPIDITEGVYTYQAINDSQALLTMTGIGLEPSPIIFQDPGPIESNEINGGLMGTFTYDSADVPTNLVHILMTFTVAGDGFIDLSQVRVFQPESTSIPAYDNVFVTVSGFNLNGDEGVPENYLGLEDIDGYGNIVAETLNLRFLNMVSDTDESYNFTLDFVTLADDLFPGVNGELPEETGTCAVTVKNGALEDVTVANAANYSWRRIPGTNTGELILSGIPNTGLPNDDELNASFILDYEALDAGTYAGPDANRSGAFTMIDTSP